MKVARVIGSVSATIKHDSLHGHKLMLLRPLDEAGKETSDLLVGIDTVQSGPGDDVLFVDEGNSARQILNAPDAPIRTVIMAVVDRVDRS